MSQNKKIENSEVGWDETVVMICTKCGIQFQATKDQEAPERIKSDLKAIAKAKLGKGAVRVITTSCLNICPVDKIAIAVASKTRPEVFSAQVVGPEVDALELFDKIFTK